MASQTELDPDKRLQLMVEQSNIVNDDVYWGTLYFSQSVVPVGPRVKNAFYSAFCELWSIPDIWLTAG